MDTNVYVLMCTLNGYKNIMEVCATKSMAEAMKTKYEGEWAWERHEFYILPMPLL